MSGAPASGDAARPLALVTRGWARVGAAIAGARGADGWALALHAHTPAGFEPALRDELLQAGATVHALAGDLAEPAVATALPGAVRGAAGRPASLLVNNA